MNKVIVVDAGFVCHKSIFAKNAELLRHLKTLLQKHYGVSIKEATPAQKTECIKKVRNLLYTNKIFARSDYNYVNFIFSYLKKIGTDKSDIIIVAKEGRTSFRKAFLLDYKGNRQKLKDSTFLIDWTAEYKEINDVEEKLDESTNWHFVQLDRVFNFADLCLTKQGKDLKIEDYDLDYSKEFGLESDDVQAVICKYFPNKEVVLITIDEDLSQLCYFNNVKIFNPNLKSTTNKAKKGFYEVVEAPLKIISKKVRSGDVSDNILVDKKKDTIRDVEVRQFIIDLINLPDWLENPITNALDNLNWDKEMCYEKLPFQNSLAQEFDKIYETNNIRTMKESIVRHCLKEMKTIEKRSKKTKEQLYEKNANYKKFKDEFDKHKKQKVKQNV